MCKFSVFCIPHIYRARVTHYAMMTCNDIVMDVLEIGGHMRGMCWGEMAKMYRCVSAYKYVVCVYKGRATCGVTMNGA